MATARSIIGRRSSGGAADERQQLPIRESGTKTNLEYSYDQNPKDGELGPAIGRTANYVKTPDADFFLVQTVNGDRLQDFANTHLSEGTAPGRIPRRWTNLVSARLGKHITGEPNGDTGMYSANAMSGGAEDRKYIPHLGIPRGSVIARAYKRTVDDAAPIPAIYVSDPTRR